MCLILEIWQYVLRVRHTVCSLLCTWTCITTVTLENWLDLVNSCIYYAHQTHKIYQVQPYSVDFKAPRELWNPLSKTVLSKCSFIIRPFEKRDVLCRGNVRPSVRLSVRLSVRPSVRPRFPDFSSTCFEISIWNLVYTFSRWHDMSSLSCITIGSLWPSLQPKVGQTYFLQSWPHKWR